MWDVKNETKTQDGRNVLSFTLTMWDVKEYALIWSDNFKRFYLNYVGCKDNKANSSSLAPFGFTLTMWDVKYH